MSSSPADRYAAAKANRRSARLRSFIESLPFPLDSFQLDACRALDEGRSVLVAAPTGAGKTVVGEYAAELAIATGTRCFYTTPIKALSNQKFTDLMDRHGAAKVGLLTGDNSVNGDAQIVVMTTEVLRNMLYGGSPALAELGYVVLDEVHYLADRFRGGVWEEVIIHLPPEVAVVALSATVSNAEEFGEWLATVRGDTAVIVDEIRPVPLWQWMLVGNRLMDLFVDEGQSEPNPELVRLVRTEERVSGYGEPRRRRYFRPPSRPDVISRLDAQGLLPAITFIFSRAGCDAAVDQCVRSGLRLTTREEKLAIRRVAEERTEPLADEDLTALGYGEWLDALERGIAAHHAGMLPTFKEVVEQTFAAGLVKAVFATETLALGINMPARTVVLERLTKWNGEAHADITPAEYTQLTGRAGRRGIDVEGHAVVVWTPGVDPAQVSGLASTRTYPLRSSFRPSYNMAVNLVGSVGRHRARELLESSFAQFQADRAVVGLARQVTRNEVELSELQASLKCDRGDAAGYASLRQELSGLERRTAREAAAARRAAAASSLESLHPGDVIRIPSGRRAGLAVVVDTTPPPTVITTDRKLRRITPTDLGQAVTPLTRIKLPKFLNLRSPTSRRDIASSLRNAAAELPAPARRAPRSEDEKVVALRRQVTHHPVHDCPDREQHVRTTQRIRRLAAETDGLQARVEGRTNTIARTFDRVCSLLEEYGYLSGDSVTDAGRMLAGLYAESDLLVAECLRSGAWSKLSPAELAGVASALVYESRRDEVSAPRLPRGALREALADTVSLHARLADAEAQHRLSFLSPPDPGFVWPAYRWASGRALDEVLSESELAPGDFIRWVKQTIDLVDQIASTEGPLATAARAAVNAMRRGVVAYSSIG